jgi:anti-sigma regulatory factor (Ser/Thr protein kinase)
VLLTSELVTNALVHAGTDFDLELSGEDETIQIAVTDFAQKLPRIERVTSLSERGRGLPLVSSLSDDWGVEQNDIGKTVWFILRLPN